MSEPSAARRPTAKGMGTGSFWLCPGVAGMFWDTFSVSVRAEASYEGDTFTCGVPAWPYLYTGKTHSKISTYASLVTASWLHSCQYQKVCNARASLEALPEGSVSSRIRKALLRWTTLAC